MVVFACGSYFVLYAVWNWEDIFLLVSTSSHISKVGLKTSGYCDVNIWFHVCFFLLYCHILYMWPYFDNCHVRPFTDITELLTSKFGAWTSNRIYIKLWDVISYPCPVSNSSLAKLPLKLTLNVRGPSYLGLTRSISWLLMSWLLASPGHQQPWYWLCRMGRSLSYLRKDFNHLCHINVEEWQKMWIYVLSSLWTI